MDIIEWTSAPPAVELFNRVIICSPCPNINRCSAVADSSSGYHTDNLSSSGLKAVDTTCSKITSHPCESVKVLLELGHRSSPKVRPSAEGFTHAWEVFVRAADPQMNMQNFVERVEFNLHNSFQRHKIVVREPPYSVRESGYGGFLLPVDIYFSDPVKTRSIRILYDLVLLADQCSTHTRCEKLTFRNPPEPFRSRLIESGAVVSHRKESVCLLTCSSQGSEMTSTDSHRKVQSLSSHVDPVKVKVKPEPSDPDQTILTVQQQDEGRPKTFLQSWLRGVTSSGGVTSSSRHHQDIIKTSSSRGVTSSSFQQSWLRGVTSSDKQCGFILGGSSAPLSEISQNNSNIRYSSTLGHSKHSDKRDLKGSRRAKPQQKKQIVSTENQQPQTVSMSNQKSEMKSIENQKPFDSPPGIQSSIKKDRTSSVLVSATRNRLLNVGLSRLPARKRGRPKKCTLSPVRTLMTESKHNKDKELSSSSSKNYMFSESETRSVENSIANALSTSQIFEQYKNDKEALLHSSSADKKIQNKNRKNNIDRRRTEYLPSPSSNHLICDVRMSVTFQNACPGTESQPVATISSVSGTVTGANVNHRPRKLKHKKKLKDEERLATIVIKKSDIIQDKASKSFIDSGPCAGTRNGRKVREGFYTEFDEFDDEIDDYIIRKEVTEKNQPKSEIKSRISEKDYDKGCDDDNDVEDDNEDDDDEEDIIFVGMSSGDLNNNTEQGEAGQGGAKQGEAGQGGAEQGGNQGKKRGRGRPRLSEKTSNKRMKISEDLPVTLPQTVTQTKSQTKISSNNSTKSQSSYQFPVLQPSKQIGRRKRSSELEMLSKATEEAGRKLDLSDKKKISPLKLRKVRSVTRGLRYENESAERDDDVIMFSGAVTSLPSPIAPRLSDPTVTYFRNRHEASMMSRIVPPQAGSDEDLDDENDLSTEYPHLHVQPPLHHNPSSNQAPALPHRLNSESTHSRGIQKYFSSEGESLLGNTSTPIKPVKRRGGSSTQRGQKTSADNKYGAVSSRTKNQPIGSGVKLERIPEDENQRSSQTSSASSETSVKSDDLAPNGESMASLVELQNKLATITDVNQLNCVVEVIQQSGKYSLEDATFDFDLCNLDRTTITRLRSCLNSFR